MNKERQKHEFYRKLLTEYYFTYNLRSISRITPLGKSTARNAIGTTTSGAKPMTIYELPGGSPHEKPCFFSGVRCGMLH